MVRDREAVRLVADLLERVECGRRRVEHKRLEALADVDLLLLFGQRDDREVVEAEVLEHLEPHIELAAAAVDQDQIRQGRPLLQRPREPPREDFAERGEVVRAGDALDAEPLVVVLLHAPVFPHDHGADLLAALDMGDVVALDPVREPGQRERAAQLLEHDLLAVVAGEEMVLERDGRVRLRHRDELALRPPLGHQELDSAAGERGEPLRRELGLRELLGDQDLRRGRDRLAVELADEGREDLAGPPARDLVEEERLLAEEPSLSDEEELDAGVAPLPHDADHVLVHFVRRDDLLALPDFVQGLDLIAEHGCALELHLRRRGLHRVREPERQGLVAALEELHHVPHRLGVALTGLPARARRVAPVDRVLDARALEGAVDRDRAGPKREQLARELERLAHRRRGIEGTIVNRAVVLDPPRDQESWEIFIRRQFEKRIVFIVPQDDVVPRPVLADEVRFQHQRLELVVGHDVLEVADLADERVGLRVARPGLLEIRAHAAPQRGRLAHVEDLGLRVPVDIDARPIGQAGELLLEAHRRSRRRSALIRSRSSAACSKSSRRAASFIRASSSPIRFASSAGDANASSAGASTSTV